MNKKIIKYPSPQDNEKVYTIEEYVEKFAEDVFIKEGQFVLIQNKGTFFEKIIDAYDTEIEAFKSKRNTKGKSTIIRANVKYVKLKGIIFLYSYEQI